MARPATPRRPRKRSKADLIVSLDDFASVCSITPETMRKHLVDAPDDAPWMIERGRRGVGYKIQLAGAVAWWKDRSNAGDQDADRHRAAVAEWRMEHLGDGGDDEGFHLTGKERAQEFNAGIAELEYRQLIGELAKVATIYDETVNAVIELRRQLLRVGPEIRKQFGFDKEHELAIEEAIGKRLTAFIGKLGVDVAPEAG